MKVGLMMMGTRATVLALVLGAGILFWAGGCTSDITVRTMRSNMSPDMEGMAEDAQLRANRHAKTFDINLRQINDDIDRIFLLDRPMRLSPYPMP